jgi:hypothetical protein
MTPNLLRILLEEALVEDRDDPYMVLVVSLLEASSSPVASMDTLFEFFEAYPDQVFGLPGALTHYLESFPHELLQTKLFASTERQPAYTTLFMLRRLANGTVGAERDRALKHLEMCSQHPLLTEYCRQQLALFLGRGASP